jgi:steroid delta-isomerase-like uncharacterized protein
MKKSNISTVEKLFAAWNSHDAEQVLSFYDDAFTREDVNSNYVYGKEKLHNVVERYLLAFPDIFFNIDDLMEKGGKLVVCWTASGHHRDKIMNIPATGKYISFKGVSVLHIENEKIMNVWYLWDEASMLRQMGLLPELQHTSL